MRKYFCDKCEKEITVPIEDGRTRPMITGSFFIKNKRHNSKINIWVDWECRDDTVEHICKDCLFDALHLLDYRYGRMLHLDKKVDEDMDDEMEKCEYKDEPFLDPEEDVTDYKPLRTR